MKTMEYPPRWAVLQWHNWEMSSLYDNRPFFKEIVAPIPDGSFMKFKRTEEIAERQGEPVLVYRAGGNI